MLTCNYRYCFMCLKRITSTEKYYIYMKMLTSLTLQFSLIGLHTKKTLTVGTVGGNVNRCNHYGKQHRGSSKT